jgi:hypothetical protein
VASLADQINNGPMLFALLEMIQSQRHGFMPTQAAREQQCEQGSVAFSFQSQPYRPRRCAERPRRNGKCIPLLFRRLRAQRQSLHAGLHGPNRPVPQAGCLSVTPAHRPRNLEPNLRHSLTTERLFKAGCVANILSCPPLKNVTAIGRKQSGTWMHSELPLQCSQH